MVQKKTDINGGGGSSGDPAVQSTIAAPGVIDDESEFFEVVEAEQHGRARPRSIGGPVPEQSEADGNTGAASEAGQDQDVYILEVEHRDVMNRSTNTKLTRLCVPAMSTISFGPMVVGSAAAKFPACFRVYEGAKKNAICIAAITGVLSFWREDIKTAGYCKREGR